MSDDRIEHARAVEEAGGHWFWLGLVAGWAVIAYGLWGIFSDHDATNPPGLARWVVGGALVHDLLIAPMVLAVGAVLVRVLPRRARGPACGALALSGIVVLFAYPLLRGFGRHERNSSTLPLDYTTNVIVVLAVIWVIAIAVVVHRCARRERT